MASDKRKRLAALERESGGNGFDGGRAVHSLSTYIDSTVTVGTWIVLPDGYRYRVMTLGSVTEGS